MQSTGNSSLPKYQVELVETSLEGRWARSRRTLSQAQCLLCAKLCAMDTKMNKTQSVIGRNQRLNVE